jgi:hypothetical protein
MKYMGPHFLSASAAHIYDPWRVCCSPVPCRASTGPPVGPLVLQNLFGPPTIYCGTSHPPPGDIALINSN